jgi:alpha-N-arabinofuranosidase
MRDALVAALTLDIFNRHADKVAMANVAQLINNLHSLFLAHEDKLVPTPNFHVFEMYAAHHHGQSLRAVFDTPGIEVPGGQGGELPGLAGSASLHEKRLVLTVVNPHATGARATEIRVRGAGIKSATGLVLAADDIHAHNSFAQPTAVTPRPVAAQARGSSLIHSFAPASVTRLELTLG